MQRIIAAQAFDGGDLAAFALDSKHQAGIQRHAVDDDGTGTAFALAASVLGAGVSEHVAQHIERRHVDRHAGANRPAVERKGDFNCYGHHRASVGYRS
jgi:hypothetical protein